jgi:hypothetical protein
MSKYPISTSTIVTEKGEETFKPIHDVIGKLRYLVDRTRPDLLFPLNLLSRFMTNPTKQVMEELLRLIRYVNHTKSNHLTVGGDNCIQLEGMCDAAYVQNGDCISQLGYAIYLNKAGGAVYCRSMRASTVSLSSTQAEVDGLVELTKEIIWFQGFLKSINVDIVKPTIVRVDNMPTVTLAAEGNHLRRSKHYVVRIAFIKQAVEDGVIKVDHIPGVKNHADILTKALTGANLQAHTVGILGQESKANT